MVLRDANFVRFNILLFQPILYSYFRSSASFRVRIGTVL